MLVNLTSHDIVVRTPDGDIIIKPSGEVARVASEQEVIARHAEVDIVKTVFGEVKGLPDPVPNTVYITSSQVAMAVASWRDDVVSPDTGPTAIRDDNGRIAAVIRLQRF